VHSILENPAYFGKTYTFRETRVVGKGSQRGHTRHRKTQHVSRPREEWIEVPNATPAIISEEMFLEAQARLQRNREVAKRNGRRAYLLRGFIKCRQCGRHYAGATSVRHYKGKTSETGYYRCGDRAHCSNKGYLVEHLNRAVWEKIEALLRDPDMVMTEIERRYGQADDAGLLEKNLDRTSAQLLNIEKQKKRVWRAFEITGDEESFKHDIGGIQKKAQALQQEKSKLEAALQANRKFKPTRNDVERACHLVSQNLKSLSLDEKRMAMEALQVRVWIDGNSVEIEGAIPVPEVSIASKSLT